MKKCIFCTAELEDNQHKCDYCGKDQDSNQLGQSVNQNLEMNSIINDNNEVMTNNIYYKGSSSSIMQILFIISVIICMISCFLPYFSIFGISQNYVYQDTKILDGVFILAFGVVAVLTALFKKKIPPLIFQLLSLGVFLYDYINQKTNEYSNIISRLYGIGFYLLFIFLIGSVILAIVRLAGKDKFK